MADDLNLFVSRLIKLICLAKVAAVVAQSWNFSVLLLQCLLCKTINSPLNSGIWIHKKSIHKWIYFRNLSCDFLNSLILIHIAYFTSEINIWILIYFSVMNSCHEFISMNLYYCICEFKVYTYEFITWIHILMTSYTNSESIYMNSYTWIHILLNSCGHFIYEFMWTMNSYDHFMYEFM